MKRILCIIVFLLSGLVATLGQTVDELNAQIKKAEEAIAKNERLLKNIADSKKSNETEVKLLRQKIKNRETIVANYKKQIAIISDSISLKTSDVNTMQGEINALKDEYAQMVRALHKNYLVGAPLHFIFSAEDAHTATQRMNLLARYNRAIDEKTRTITEQSLAVEQEIGVLDQKKSELDRLRTEQQKALNKLANEKKQLDAAAKKLAKEEKQIAKEIKKRKEEREKAQKSIKKIMEEEARKNKKKVSEQERKAISVANARFEGQKGKMIMPVEGGVIIEQFGQHPHPTQKHITIDNTGINIAATAGAEVKCVAEGSVSRVMVIPGLNHCVMVKHGDYFTLYANMAAVSVSKGDQLQAGSKVGTLATSDNPDDHQLHFELWYMTLKQDPEPWIVK
jgi:septal ring factor EnvC (AmiA/AmiB activator)